MMLARTLPSRKGFFVMSGEQGSADLRDPPYLLVSEGTILRSDCRKDVVMSTGDEERDRARERFREEAVSGLPSKYSPVAHLASSGGMCFLAAVIAATHVTSFGIAEAVTAVVTVVLLNVFEWWAHRKPMHHRWPLLGVLFTSHTKVHHRIYRWEDMGIRDRREWFFVLIPFTVLAQTVGLSLVLILGLGWAFGWNIALLVLAIEGAYLAAYEGMHLLYHAPRESWAGRNRVIRRLAEHHARHHDPRLMQRWNFNITVPLADKMFGTLASDELVEETQGARAAP